MIFPDKSKQFNALRDVPEKMFRTMANVFNALRDVPEIMFLALRCSGDVPENEMFRMFRPRCSGLSITFAIGSSSGCVLMFRDVSALEIKKLIFRNTPPYYVGGDAGTSPLRAWARAREK